MSKLIAAVAPYKKAIAGGIGGGLSALGTSLAAGVDTRQTLVAVLLGALAGTGLVYIAPRNQTKA